MATHSRFHCRGRYLNAKSRFWRVSATSSLLVAIAIASSSTVSASSPGSDNPTWTSLPTLAQITDSLASASAQTTLTPQDVSGLQEGNPFPDAEENGSQQYCVPSDEMAYLHAPCVYGDTSSTKVIAVVGDSEADMWIPTFDVYGKEFGFKIDRLVMDGCTAWEEKAPTSIAEWSACEVKWKKYCVKEIYKLHPYAVVATGMLVDSQSKAVVELPSITANGIESYFSALKASKAKLFVLSNIPWDFSISTLPLTCVEVHTTEINDCDASLDPTMTSAIQAVKQSKFATVVPIDQLFCSPAGCPVVDGENVVYADNHHMSHAWSIYIARAFSQIFNPLLGVK